MLSKTVVLVVKWLLLSLLCCFFSCQAEQKTVLVVGGAGFIGSHVNKMLQQAGYQTIILDNLSKGNSQTVSQGVFVQGDMSDSNCLDRLFNTYHIDAVMHFAAYIDVGESVVDPSIYYTNNITNTLNLLEAMRRHSVSTFIFSSSAAIFGFPQEIPIKENHPCHPLNPYGRTKWMVEEILKDYSKAYGLKYCCLRYFNAAGGDPEGQLRNFKRKESNLIPVVLRSLKQPGGTITVFGDDYPTHDGTCIRDYVHVYDLGTAHILAMERLFAGHASTCYNLGNGKGFSVREVLQAVEKVTGLRPKVIQGLRRDGDAPYLVADSTKARTELGWCPQYSSLDQMIQHAWQALK
jgi:UDP-glucose 4-epimerase